MKTNQKNMKKENTKKEQEKKVPCEVYSRVVGYYRPVQNWNDGKQEEFKHRLEFDEKASISSKRQTDQ